MLFVNSRAEQMSVKNVLERNDGRCCAQVSHRCVQQINGILQLQFLIQRHDAGLSFVVSEQDVPQNTIIKLLKPDTRTKKMTEFYDDKLAILCAHVEGQCKVHPINKNDKKNYDKNVYKCKPIGSLTCLSSSNGSIVHTGPPHHI